MTRPKLGDFIVDKAELDWRAKDIFDEVRAGKVTYKIGAVLPFSEVRQAHDDLEGRRTSGKLLLRCL